MSTDGNLDRRMWLTRAGAGFGAIALAGLLDRTVSPAAAVERLASPLSPKPPHFAPRAKSIIHLFMHGGPSQVDTFDPKPELARHDGQAAAEKFHSLPLQFTDIKNQKLLGSRQTFKRCGESGIEICDSLPLLQACADELCVIRSMHHEQFNHTPAIWFMNTGSAIPGRPSLGAWLAYGLGCAADNLPAFVVMNAAPLKPGPGVWGSGFLPAVYQGTRLLPGVVPIPHLKPPAALAGSDQRALVDYVQSLNRTHFAERQDSELESRIAAYELAFRMQAAAPDAVDLSRETAATRELYGGGFGEQCLIARRLVERGVRCVQIYHGGGPDDWDTHGGNHDGQTRRMREIDRGCAALLQDLRRTGLLDSTLVAWTGEFGRTPSTEGNDGRDHSPYGYSMWLAGGGVRRGIVHGASDELGFVAVDKPVHLHDLNATLLHLMGLDHQRLTHHYDGRNFRLTDVHGQVVQDILA